MLKRDITFKDWDDKTVTETHYFNLNITELMELDLEGILKKLSNTQNTAEVALEIKKIVLAAVGERDGKYFIKEDYVAKRFQQTGAYNALIVELSNDAAGAAEFINSLLPAELAAQLAKAREEEAAAQTNASTQTAEIAASSESTSQNS